MCYYYTLVQTQTWKKNAISSNMNRSNRFKVCVSIFKACVSVISEIYFPSIPSTVLLVEFETVIDSMEINWKEHVLKS